MGLIRACRNARRVRTSAAATGANAVGPAKASITKRMFAGSLINKSLEISVPTVVRFTETYVVNKKIIFQSLN